MGSSSSSVKEKNGLPKLPPNSASLNSKVVWCWKSNHNPWSSSEKAEWTEYTDIENKIIEEAYKKGESTVSLDNYIINLEERIQMHKGDSNKQRPVMRKKNNQNEAHLRKERFFLNPMLSITVNPTREFYPSLLSAWILKRRQRKELPSLNMWDLYLGTIEKSQLYELVKETAEGIIQEGKLLSLESEAKWIAKVLTEGRNLNINQLGLLCFYLYSRESFLYQSVNMMLREEDYNKVDTLGPFAMILFMHLCGQERHAPTYTKQVYRGAMLTSEMIEEYKKIKKSTYPYFAWYSFVSTTKNIKKAKKFGTTLFVINFDERSAPGDLSSFSAFSHEEEILLRANSHFRIDDIKIEEGRYIIFLTASVNVMNFGVNHQIKRNSDIRV